MDENTTPKDVIKFRYIGDSFFEPELKSGYEQGLTYTCREPDDILRKHLTLWLEQGRAVVLDRQPGESAPAEISGVGTVT